MFRLLPDGTLAGEYINKAGQVTATATMTKQENKK